MSNFQFKTPCGAVIPIDFSTYPDGTENIILDEAKLSKFVESEIKHILVEWKFEHHGIDMFRLALISNYIDFYLTQAASVNFNVKVDYLPHARADRKFPTFAANPLETFMNFFDELAFDSLIIEDVHNLKNLEKNTISCIHNIIEPKGFLAIPDAVYVAPDQGAKARIKENLRILQSSVVRSNQFLMVTKQRDPATGAVTQVFPDGYKAGIKDKTCFIIDDICDGGRTFIGLGEKLKAAGASRVTLVVTHGIFSQGLEVFKGKIDYIWVKNCVGKVTQEDVHLFNQGK